MARKKARTAIHQPFEGVHPTGRFAKICLDMLESPAWKKLSLRQRGLYLEIKSRYCPKTVNGVTTSNANELTFPKTEWEPLYGDYRTFVADRQALEHAGFIRVVARGKYTRTPNLYGLDTAWRLVTPTPQPPRTRAVPRSLSPEGTSEDPKETH